MRSPENIFSGPAAADYSAAGYIFGTVDSSGNVAKTGNTAQAIGVITNAPTSGAQARLNWGGVQKILAGTGGLALGAKVMSDANGKGITATGAGAFYMGICTKAAAATETAEFAWSPGSIAG
jgi:hypothetical protein